MNFRFKSLTHGNISFNENIPEGMQKYRIPGSEISTAVGRFGQIFIQEIKATNFIIWYSVYSIQEDTVFQIETDEPILKAHIALQNEMSWYINNLGNISVPESQFVIWYVPSVVATSEFTQNKEYHFLDIHYAPVLLEPLGFYFPLLHPFLYKVHTNVATQLSTAPLPITTAIKEVIKSIVEYSFEEFLLPIYYDNQIRSLLLQLLRVAQKEEKTETVFISKNVDSSYTAKELIEVKFAGTLTLQQIAKEVGISESKLKKDFKQVFAISPKQYLQHVRMKKAVELLKESNILIKNIPRLVGYRDSKRFMTAFKKYFGQTPGSVRKKDMKATLIILKDNRYND